ncbi:MAG: site-2 protease family protein [Rhodobacteraceae bacterium]|nr:site-2 protease family protein [Alphaproteobacteria bacterium]MBT8474639.1 site-2 protease family protein [Alphaproteobacteria bacterium]NNK66252.1 site-2 protease family protein [Paracoccaceae bacterium]
MFPRAVKLFTFYGFDIKVDPSWMLIAALLVWSLSAHYFPSVFPDQTTFAYLTMAVLGMLGLFASLLLHELSHSLVARVFDVEVRAITLFLFGGVAELREEPKSAIAELWIALAGPVMSFALAIGFALAAAVAGQLSLGDPTVTVLGYLGTVNLILAVFNLLPAFPLDGGRAFRALLWARSGNILKATETAATSGIVIAYVLIGLGLLLLFGGYFVQGFWQIMLGGFLVIAARASYEHALQTAAFAGLTVADAMTRDPVTAHPEMTLAHVINQIILHNRVSFLPVVEDGVLLGSIDSDVLRKIDRDNWANTKVDDVFVGLAKEMVLSPETGLDAVLDQIARTGQRKFLVARGHRLVGVITLADLTRYLGLARIFEPRFQHG